MKTNSNYLNSELRKQFNKSKLNLLTYENERLVKSLKKPGGFKVV